MIVYARIIDESPPFAVPLANDSATVSDLLELVRGVPAGGGRNLQLLLDGAEGGARLADLGVVEGDLVNLIASGKVDPNAVLPHVVPVLDFEALFEAPDPSARRLSEYEEVTQLTQWRGPYHIDGGRRLSHQELQGRVIDDRLTVWRQQEVVDVLRNCCNTKIVFA